MSLEFTRALDEMVVFCVLSGSAGVSVNVAQVQGTRITQLNVKCH